MKKFYSACIFCLVLSLFSCKEKEYIFKAGDGIATYTTDAIHGNREVKIHYYIPSKQHDKAQFVMHGAGRNADDYLAGWVELAKEYNFAVFVPEFPKQTFPNRDYQEGGVLNSQKEYRGKDSTTYQLIDNIFEFINDNSETTYSQFNIFGHSAGGQFVHRFMQLHKSPYVSKAVAANAGWYTFPTDTISFPYGIKNWSENADNIRKEYFAKNLVVLLGTADTIRDKDFRVTPEAEAQGSTRLERGKTFFDFAAKEAAKEGYTFSWQIGYVPDVGHSGSQIASAAAKIIYK